MLIIITVSIDRFFLSSPLLKWPYDFCFSLHTDRNERARATRAKWNDLVFRHLSIQRQIVRLAMPREERRRALAAHSRVYRCFAFETRHHVIYSINQFFYCCRFTHSEDGIDENCVFLSDSMKSDTLFAAQKWVICTCETSSGVHFEPIATEAQRIWNNHPYTPYVCKYDLCAI